MRLFPRLMQQDAGLSAVHVIITTVAKTILGTTRLVVEGDRRVLDECGDGPPIYVFWHGKQLPLLVYNPHWTLVTMVSTSRDGELLARVLQDFGHVIVRGSSRRGGAEGYAELKKMLAMGYAPCFAADGPTGPLHVIKPGAIRLAAETGRPIVPASALATKYKVIGSWDRLEVPLPYSTVAMVFGRPLRFDRTALGPAGLDAAIKEVSAAIETCSKRAGEIIKKD